MIESEWKEVAFGDVPPLAPSDIHLWRIDLDSPPAASVAQARTLLTPEEILRADRFVRPEHQARFALVRGTLRQVLGHYTGTDPKTIALAENEFGKPSLKEFPSIKFNVSHTDPVALIGVNLEHEIGVDVESTQPRDAWQKIVKRYFTEDEISQLFALDEAEGLTGFYRLWTLKEAYMKARGRGLSWGLDKFSMRGADGQECGVDWDLNDEAAADKWVLELVDVGSGATGALATRYAEPVVFTFSM
jgi:4'-phosphopantetheinyl transferase